MRKVLQLATYPIVKPLHGGQIRAWNINKFFKDNGFETRYISVCEPAHGDYGEHDIQLAYKENSTKDAYVEDYRTMNLAADGGLYEKLKKSISEFDPDLIFMEQMWLWKAVKRMKSENLLKEEVQIVYSSQNVESVMKADILASEGLSGDYADKIVADILDIEKDVCENADVVITCTNADAEIFSGYGAKELIVCPNGVNKRNISSEWVSKVKELVGDRKYALFIGSGHPPNAVGFWEMMGGSLAFLPPEHIVISAGSVCSIMEKYMPDEYLVFRDVNFERNKMMGIVSEEVLAALIECADVIMLPITVGGGSNLKTAEAIASGKPVVSTSKACRGFDFVSELTGFEVADDSGEFKKKLSLLLSGTAENRVFSDKEKELRNSVYWDNCLGGLSHFVE